MKHPAVVLLLCASCLGACRPGADSDRLSVVETAAPAARASAASPGSAAQMTESAVALLGALSDEDRRKTTFALDDEAARTNWSNLPAAMVERGGIRFGDLSDAQRRLAHDLIRSSTSSQGYQKIAGIMRLDDMLREASQERLG